MSKLKTFIAVVLSILIPAQSVQALSFGSPSAARVFSIALPSSVGYVSETYSPSGSAKPDFILIQNLHVNRSVQFAISRILKRLKTQNLMPESIAIEGATGPVDIGFMQRYPDLKIRKAAADYLVQQGEMPGAMHFAVSEGTGRLFGIETDEYYQANLEMFRRSYKERAALRQEIENIQAVLPRLKKDAKTRANAEILEKDVNAVSALINNQVIPDELSSTLAQASAAVEHLKLILPEETAKNLIQPLSASVNFYALALIRNDELFKNALTVRQQENQKTSIVITGGFHTQALAEMCKRQGFSYAVITPNVKHHDHIDETLYVERLLDHHLTPAQLETGFDWSSMRMLEAGLGYITEPAHRAWNAVTIRFAGLTGSRPRSRLQRILPVALIMVFLAVGSLIAGGAPQNRVQSAKGSAPAQSASAPFIQANHTLPKPDEIVTIGTSQWRVMTTQNLSTSQHPNTGAWSSGALAPMFFDLNDNDQNPSDLYEIRIYPAYLSDIDGIKGFQLSFQDGKNKIDLRGKRTREGKWIFMRPAHPSLGQAVFLDKGTIYALRPSQPSYGTPNSGVSIYFSKSLFNKFNKENMFLGIQTGRYTPPKDTHRDSVSSEEQFEAGGDDASYIVVSVLREVKPAKTLQQGADAGSPQPKLVESPLLPPTGEADKTSSRSNFVIQDEEGHLVPNPEVGKGGQSDGAQAPAAGSRTVDLKVGTLPSDFLTNPRMGILTLRIESTNADHPLTTARIEVMTPSGKQGVLLSLNSRRGITGYQALPFDGANKRPFLQSVLRSYGDGTYAVFELHPRSNDDMPLTIHIDGNEELNATITPGWVLPESPQASVGAPGQPTKVSAQTPAAGPKSQKIIRQLMLSASMVALLAVGLAFLGSAFLDSSTLQAAELFPHAATAGAQGVTQVGTNYFAPFLEPGVYATAAYNVVHMVVEGLRSWIQNVHLLNAISDRLSVPLSVMQFEVNAKSKEIFAIPTALIVGYLIRKRWNNELKKMMQNATRIAA